MSTNFMDGGYSAQPRCVRCPALLFEAKELTEKMCAICMAKVSSETKANPATGYNFCGEVGFQEFNKPRVKKDN